MDQQLAPAELLRFLQAEAVMLQQIQVKISNELYLLQVEEDLFVRTAERLSANAGSNRSTTTTKSAAPSGMGFDNDMYEYELLYNLESEDE